MKHSRQLNDIFTGGTMNQYVIRDYRKGFEKDHARIGIQVAREWTWPYAYDEEDLLQIASQPGFDPETRHYCFLGEEMVGCMFTNIAPAAEGEVRTATVDFPRMLPGHEDGATLLMERAFEALQGKGVKRIEGRVTTMAPGDVQLAQACGFSLKDWGYKVYYAYEMAWGKLAAAEDAAEEIDPEKDLEACAEIASRWYGRPAKRCRPLLAEWHEMGIITHAGVRREEKLVASCMAAANPLRPSTAANYYIYAPDDESLKPLLARVVRRCIDGGIHNLIADLIHDHRQYEPVYEALGFKKVAEWSRCEKVLG